MTQIAKSGRMAAIFMLTAGMASSFPAHAEDALSVKGYFTQSIGLYDIDDREGRSFEDEIFTRNAEIHFAAKKKLENGTTLAARNAEISAIGMTIDLRF
jgi:hypothetical protein